MLLAAAMFHGDKEFNGKVTAAIQKMKDDSTLSKLSVKWCGVEPTPRSRDREALAIRAVRRQVRLRLQTFTLPLFIALSRSSVQVSPSSAQYQPVSRSRYRHLL
ncbi:hypothetical protein NKH80_28535 [Mesorhizobium sp. M0904]|uniref:hypothetical protein n=1 Tax=Mesorhizobium sp. M0904 TaxID=2957022 RepID=UPI003336F431